MLCYKMWRETRTRLLISATALAWVCLAIVLTQKGNRAHADPPLSYAAYIWKAVYKGYVRDFFLILVIVLGGGGILQERAHGTAGFTLSLPVSRCRLTFVRAAVGLAEVALLALMPAVMLGALSPQVGESYQLTQALRFSVLWTMGGAVLFGTSVLLSGICAEEYSAWIVCFLSMMFYSAAVNITPLQRIPWLNFFKIMSGAEMPYFNSADHLLVGPLPGLPLLILPAIAVGFVIIAARLSQRRDY